MYLTNMVCDSHLSCCEAPAADTKLAIVVNLDHGQGGGKGGMHMSHLAVLQTMLQCHRPRLTFESSCICYCELSQVLSYS